MKTRKRTKTTEITVERSEVFVVRKSGKQIYAWCGQCAERVRMLTPERAAEVSGVRTRTIYRWVEAREIHFVETPEGFLLICRESLNR